METSSLGVFTQVDGMSAVSKQSSSEEERVKALQGFAFMSNKLNPYIESSSSYCGIHKTLPIPINEQKLPPRYTERLVKAIKRMGGARYMFLTHQDDVADHEKWSEHLGCERILHVEDVNISTANVEVKLEGGGPWELDEDVTLTHTPGHTEGSVCLFYKSKKILGDHRLMNEFDLSICEQYNWFSVPVQLNSVRKLLELDCEGILPGHGRRVQFQSMRKECSFGGFLSCQSSIDLR